MDDKKPAYEVPGAKTRNDTMGASAVLASVLLSFLTGALFL